MANEFNTTVFDTPEAPVNNSATSSLGVDVPVPQQPAPESPGTAGPSLPPGPSPAVAGPPDPTFFPEDPSQLQRQAQNFVGGAASTGAFLTVDVPSFIIDTGLDLATEGISALGRSIMDVPARARNVINAQDWIRRTILPEPAAPGTGQAIADRAAFEAGGALAIAPLPMLAAASKAKTVVSAAASMQPVSRGAATFLGTINHYGRSGYLLLAEGALAATQGAGAEFATSSIPLDETGKRIATDLGTQLLIALGTNTLGGLGRASKRYVVDAVANPQKFAKDEVGAFLGTLKQDYPLEWAKVTDYLEGNSPLNAFFREADGQPTTAQIANIGPFTEMQSKAASELPSVQARFTKEVRKGREQLIRSANIEDAARLPFDDLGVDIQKGLRKNIAEERRNLLNRISSSQTHPVFPPADIDSMATAGSWEEMADMYNKNAQASYLESLDRLAPLGLKQDDAADLFYNHTYRAKANYDAKTNALYDNVPVGEALDTSDLDATAQNLLAEFSANKMLRPDDIPETFKRFTAAADKNGSTRTLRDVRDIRSFAIQEQLELAEKAGLGHKKVALSQFKKALDNELTRWDEAIPTLKEANLRYARGNQLFNQNEAGKILERGSRGEARNLSPIAGAELFWNNKDRTGARKRFAEMLKEGEVDPAEMNNAVAAYARATMLQTVDADGSINPRRLQTWIRANRAKWEGIPALKKEILDLDKLAAADTQAERSLKAIDKGAAQLMLGADPDVIVETLFKQASKGDNPRTVLREAFTKVKGDAAAEAGLRRSVLGKLMSKATKAIEDPEANIALDPEGLNDILSNPTSRALLKEVYSDRHLDYMNDLVEAARTIERGHSLGRTAASKHEDLTNTMTSVLARVYAFESGRIGSTFFGSDIAIRIMSRLVKSRTQKEWAVLTEKSLYDPQTANSLADLASASLTQRRAEKIFRQESRRFRHTRRAATTNPEGAGERTE